MTMEELKALLADPNPRAFWTSTKPGVTAALGAVERAESAARKALLAAHTRHYRGLREAVEAACEADGGHLVSEIGGDFSSFGDRWCRTCKRRFPRWAALGPYRAVPQEPSQGGEDTTNDAAKA